jgi:hypothetical protein
MMAPDLAQPDAPTTRNGICAACSVELSDGGELCPHHHASFAGDHWAYWNRVMCDLIHRGIEPPVLPASEPVPATEDASLRGFAAVAVCLEGVA